MRALRKPWTKWTLSIRTRQTPPTNGRRRYTISIATDIDIRPELFKLVKRNDWMLWELHHEALSLGELFRTLTDESMDIPAAGDGGEADANDNE